ncbi:hypothetical protein Lser_V15G14303 [Lactuca serriola]
MQSTAARAIVRIVDSECSKKHHVSKNKQTSQWSYGRLLSWMLVKGFVLFELLDMIVVACLCFLDW